MIACYYTGKNRTVYEEAWNATMKELQAKREQQENIWGYAMTVRAVASSGLYLQSEGPQYVHHLAVQKAVDYYLAKGEFRFIQ